MDIIYDNYEIFVRMPGDYEWLRIYTLDENSFWEESPSDPIGYDLPGSVDKTDEESVKAFCKAEARRQLNLALKEIASDPRWLEDGCELEFGVEAFGVILDEEGEALDNTSIVSRVSGTIEQMPIEEGYPSLME